MVRDISGGAKGGRRVRAGSSCGLRTATSSSPSPSTRRSGWRGARTPAPWGPCSSASSPRAAPPCATRWCEASSSSAAAAGARPSSSSPTATTPPPGPGGVRPCATSRPPAIPVFPIGFQLSALDFMIKDRLKDLAVDHRRGVLRGAQERAPGGRLRPHRQAAPQPVPHHLPLVVRQGPRGLPRRARRGQGQGPGGPHDRRVLPGPVESPPLNPERVRTSRGAMTPWGPPRRHPGRGPGRGRGRGRGRGPEPGSLRRYVSKARSNPTRRSGDVGAENVRLAASLPRSRSRSTSTSTSTPTSTPRSVPMGAAGTRA